MPTVNIQYYGRTPLPPDTRTFLENKSGKLEEIFSLLIFFCKFSVLFGLLSYQNMFFPRYARFRRDFSTRFRQIFVYRKGRVQTFAENLGKYKTRDFQWVKKDQNIDYCTMVATTKAGVFRKFEPCV